MADDLRTPFCPVLVGPTAVGKTGLVLRMASEFPIEVISLDSRQIYRGMRIGTAQPDERERSACPHHLVDFLSPDETWSAQDFRERFCRLHEEIRGRERIPVVVGGAGLYLTAITDGFFRIDSDPDALQGIRARLDALPDAEIRERLASADPESHARIHANDRYRSQRALELLELTGRTMTDLLRNREADPALGLSFPVVILDRDRGELRRRIAMRLARMLETGWMQETRDLLDLHGPDAPGLRTLGYRELVAHLREGVDMDTTRERILLHTGQYAKRQQTWFGARPGHVSGAPEDPRVLAALRDLLDAHLRSWRT